MKVATFTLIGALAMASPAVAAAGRPGPFGLSITRSTFVNGDVLSIRGGAVHESTTLSDLDSIVQSAALQDKLTVIDFTATWCGPCQAIAPLYKELSDEFGSRANFVKVDVDTNQEAAQKYGVTAMPTFIFVKGGQEVDRMMGANKDRLRELIEELAF